MRTTLILGLTCLLIPGGLSTADEPVFSGPQPGESISSFKARAFSGAKPGTEIELAKAGENGARVIVFVHELTRPGLQLLRPVDLYGAKHAADGLAVAFVWLTADVAATEQFLNRAKNSLNLVNPVVISLDGREGPGAYGLNRNVTLTILVVKDQKVSANFAIIQPNETDAPKVLGAVAKLLGKPAPTMADVTALTGGRNGSQRPIAMTAPSPANSDASRRIDELETAVNRLTDALDEARARIAKLEGKDAPRPLPRIAKAADAPKSKGEALPGISPKSPDLIALMRRMIQRTNTDDDVKTIADEMTAWAGNDAEKKAELTGFAVRIAHLGYGTEAARKAIKKLAGE